MASFPEVEEQKPKIMMPAGQNIAPSPMIGNYQLHTETTSDSAPRLHTESSSSEQVVSPDVTWEKEVQSEMESGFNYFDNLQFNFMDGFAEDPFASQVQYQMDQLSPLLDMSMYLQKPF